MGYSYLAFAQHTECIMQYPCGTEDELVGGLQKRPFVLKKMASRMSGNDQDRVLLAHCAPFKRPSSRGIEAVYRTPPIFSLASLLKLSSLLSNKLRYLSDREVFYCLTVEMGSFPKSTKRAFLRTFC